MGRSIVAVVAAYVGMVVVTLITFAVLGLVAPEAFSDPYAFPPMPWVLIVLAMAFGGGLVGGLILRWIARGSIVKHAVWLACVMVVLWAVSWAMNPVPQPVWYMVAVLVLGIVGVFAAMCKYVMPSSAGEMSG